LDSGDGGGKKLPLAIIGRSAVWNCVKGWLPFFLICHKDLHGTLPLEKISGSEDLGHFCHFPQIILFNSVLTN
jgi:hypothetical protein